MPAAHPGSDVVVELLWTAADVQALCDLERRRFGERALSREQILMALEHGFLLGIRRRGRLVAAAEIVTEPYEGQEIGIARLRDDSAYFLGFVVETRESGVGMGASLSAAADMVCLDAGKRFIDSTAEPTNYDTLSVGFRDGYVAIEWIDRYYEPVEGDTGDRIYLRRDLTKPPVAQRPYQVMAPVDVDAGSVGPKLAMVRELMMSGMCGVAVTRYLASEGIAPVFLMALAPKSWIDKPLKRQADMVPVSELVIGSPPWRPCDGLMMTRYGSERRLPDGSCQLQPGDVTLYIGPNMTRLGNMLWCVERVDGSTALLSYFERNAPTNRKVASAQRLPTRNLGKIAPLPLALRAGARVADVIQLYRSDTFDKGSSEPFDFPAFRSLAIEVAGGVKVSLSTTSELLRRSVAANPCALFRSILAEQDPSILEQLAYLTDQVMLLLKEKASDEFWGKCSSDIGFRTLAATTAAVMECGAEAFIAAQSDPSSPMCMKQALAVAQLSPKRYFSLNA